MLLIAQYLKEYVVVPNTIKWHNDINERNDLSPKPTFFVTGIFPSCRNMFLPSWTQAKARLPLGVWEHWAHGPWPLNSTEQLCRFSICDMELINTRRKIERHGSAYFLSAYIRLMKRHAWGIGWQGSWCFQKCIRNMGTLHVRSWIWYVCVGGGGGVVQGPACRPAKAMLADFGVRCTFSHEPRLVFASAKSEPPRTGKWGGYF